MPTKRNDAADQLNPEGAEPDETRDQESSVDPASLLTTQATGAGTIKVTG
jgi:hypothetical protein